jgi:hypothetical protein
MSDKQQNEGLVPLSLVAAILHEMGFALTDRAIQQEIRAGRLRVQTRCGRTYIADADLDAYCAEQVTQDLARNTSLVTLRIFSGRPDPTWTLSVRQMTHLSNLISTLTPLIPVPPMMEGGLGYQGFRVERLKDIEVRDPLFTFQGIVWLGPRGDASALIDPERRVERWLLDTGHGALSSTLYLTVESALTGKAGNSPVGEP